MTATAAACTWSSVHLSDLCEPTASTNPSSRPEEFFKYGDVSCVSNDSFKIVGATRLQGKDAPSRARQLIEHEDVIFATVRPALRRVAMVPQELHREVCSTGFCVLRANKQQLNPRFLYFYLLSEPVRQRVEALQTGATYPAINDGDLLRMEIALPPLSEQQAIAHVLQTVQKAKEARQRELVLERERKAALMERLFTHGTRGEKTNETEIGNIPESWSVLPMATVAKIERGKFAHRPRNDPAYYGGTTPFVQTGDVTASDGHITKYSQTLNERGLSVSKIFPRGTILITIAANIGFSAILEFDSAFPDSLIGITPNECIDAEFLNYYLMTQQPEMDRKAPRGTQKNINIEFLAPWKVPVPPLDEQLRIASALRASDRKSKGLRQETALLTELFDVMLKDLMTGRISASALVEKAQ